MSNKNKYFFILILLLILAILRNKNLLKLLEIYPTNIIKTNNFKLYHKDIINISSKQISSKISIKIEKNTNNSFYEKIKNKILNLFPRYKINKKSDNQYFKYLCSIQCSNIELKMNPKIYIEQQEMIINDILEINTLYGYYIKCYAIHNSKKYLLSFNYFRITKEIILLVDNQIYKYTIDNKKKQELNGFFTMVQDIKIIKNNIDNEINELEKALESIQKKSLF